MAYRLQFEDFAGIRKRDIAVATEGRQSEQQQRQSVQHPDYPGSSKMGLAV
jgi:hypothetical protein